MKLKVDYDSCEANGVCEAFAPDVFELDEDDNLHVHAEPGEENLERIRQAVQGCPKMALALEEDGQGT
ncbi:ferredoxin [Amycolatopsis acidicola]|uniref:Ferredoxin n=1 Tax=Amycolatopsis acidicola TaxID=2596893 RepID=A0A5N0UY97_9PSEU|nr:ferredoxin [Amycolatopsis acidicola]KAA9156534.1 ferredoxin [Amycolatopsis acidicola]